jgi:hypothetical protein
MTEHELKKLGRGQLLEILVRQSKELDRLQEELKAAEDKLADRRIRMEESGSIAEAALKLNGIFEVAQQAADDYLASLRQQGLSSGQPAEEAVSLETETAEKCRQMEEQTAAKCRQMEEQTAEKCRQMEEQTAEKCRTMEEKAAAKCQAMIKQAHDGTDREPDGQEADSKVTDSQEKESPAAAGSFMDQYENLRRMLSARLGEKTDNE